jgi:bifunctional DNA-binding transcriptional regulator/antitoxin component of YhaV-PrlF toxin-antitoxin module
MAIRELEPFGIELREGGNLTIPKSLRDALRLEPGEMLRAAKVGNAIVLTLEECLGPNKELNPEVLRCQQGYYKEERLAR